LSRVVSIFVDYDEAIERLVSLIEPLLSTQFKHFPAGGADFYEARTADSVVSINTHIYDNDRDLKFEDYRYEIQFRPIRDRFYAVRERKTFVQAKAAFAELKGAANRNMILVDDLQHKLDKYESTVTAAQNR
jgi:hypothetical protein